MDLFPKVDFPMITVTTRQSGAAPEEIETEITDKIERAVNTIAGIDELRSVSTEGVSQVFIRFKLEKSVDVAAQEVRDKVNQILPDLPQDIDQPVVDKMDPDAAPVLYVALSADRPIRDISEFADKTLRREIESISGRRPGDPRRRPRCARSTSGSTRPACAPTASPRRRSPGPWPTRTSSSPAETWRRAPRS